MSDDRNLSGVWYGRYDATTHRETNGFIAQLEDNAGAVSGTISEPDTQGHEPLRRATVRGRRAGAKLEFIKHYVGFYATHAIFYGGTINEDATEISGGWTIPAVSTGRFVMSREKFAAEELEDAAELEEEIR